MLGILKLNSYKSFNEVVENVKGKDVAVLIESPDKNYITSLIFYKGDVVNYITTDEPVSGMVRLTFTIPDKYDINHISVYSFSHDDGYTNKHIGGSYWGVWFKYIDEVTSISNRKDYTINGALLIVVPWQSEDMRLNFTRLNNSTAAHGELS